MTASRPSVLLPRLHRQRPPELGAARHRRRPGRPPGVGWWPTTPGATAAATPPTIRPSTARPAWRSDVSRAGRPPGARRASTWSATRWAGWRPRSPPPRSPRVRRLVIGAASASAIVELGGVDTRVMDHEHLADVLEQDDPGAVDRPGHRRLPGLRRRRGRRPPGPGRARPARSTGRPSPSTASPPRPCCWWGPTTTSPPAPRCWPPAIADCRGATSSPATTWAPWATPPRPLDPSALEVRSASHRRDDQREPRSRRPVSAGALSHRATHPEQARHGRGTM